MECISFNDEFFSWFTNHSLIDKFLINCRIKIYQSDFFGTSNKDVVKWILAKFDSKINEMISDECDGHMMNVLAIQLWEAKGGRIDWSNSYTDSAAVYKYAIEQGHRYFVSCRENCYELYERCDEQLMMGQIRYHESVVDYLRWILGSTTLHHRKTTTSDLSVKQKIHNTLMWFIDRYSDDQNVMDLIQSYAVVYQDVSIVRKLIQLNRFNLSSIDDKSIKVWSKMHLNK